MKYDNHIIFCTLVFGSWWMFRDAKRRESVWSFGTSSWHCTIQKDRIRPTTHPIAIQLLNADCSAEVRRIENRLFAFQYFNCIDLLYGCATMKNESERVRVTAFSTLFHRLNRTILTTRICACMCSMLDIHITVCVQFFRCLSLHRLVSLFSLRIMLRGSVSTIIRFHYYGYDSVNDMQFFAVSPLHISYCAFIRAFPRILRNACSPIGNQNSFAHFWRASLVKYRPLPTMCENWMELAQRAIDDKTVETEQKFIWWCVCQSVVSWVGKKRNTFWN